MPSSGPPPQAAAIVVLVDGRNVIRSRWPNVGETELIARCGAWAEETDLAVVVVFDAAVDGLVGEWSADERTTVVGTGGESADDWLVRRAEQLAAAATPHWLITSDRELQQRAGAAAERLIGGGAFLRELGLA